MKSIVFQHTRHSIQFKTSSTLMTLFITTKYNSFLNLRNFLSVKCMIARYGTIWCQCTSSNVIGYFHRDHNAPFLNPPPPPHTKKNAYPLFPISPGYYKPPKRNRRQCTDMQTFGGKQGPLWYRSKWSICVFAFSVPSISYIESFILQDSKTIF